MRKNQFLNFWSKYQVWFYRFILLILLILAPFYTSRLSISQQADSSPTLEVDLRQFFNSPELKPIAVQYAIPADEDQQILDGTIKEIFPYETALSSDEEKAIEIERFVATLKNDPNDGTASKIIKDGYAICGGKSYVFRILNRKIGLPARYIGLFYTRTMESHVMAEIYYQDTWHLFDPTYGIFIYSEPTYNQKGHILSMKEFIEKPDSGYIQQIIDKPWQGSYNQTTRSFGVQPLNDNYLDFLYNANNNFNSYWRDEIKSATPIVYGLDNWVSLPIDADLENSNYTIFGQRNNLTDDLLHYNVQKSFAGSGNLGKIRDNIGFYNTWYIKINAPQDIKVRYWTIGAVVDMNVIRLRSAQLLDITKEAQYVDIRLRILSSPGIFIIIAQDYTGIDAVEIFKE